MAAVVRGRHRVSRHRPGRRRRAAGRASRGNMIAYVRMGIDSSAGQKIAAVDCSRLPRSTTRLAGRGGPDPRRDCSRRWQKDSCPTRRRSRLRTRNVKPWLGDRFRRRRVLVRSDPAGDVKTSPSPSQVKDEEKARAGITKLMTASRRHGRGPRRRLPRRLRAARPRRARAPGLSAAIDKGTLAANTTYVEDMKALGEQGVLSGWADATEVGEAGAGEVRRHPGRGRERLRQGRTGGVRAPLRRLLPGAGRCRSRRQGRHGDGRPAVHADRAAGRHGRGPVGGQRR